MLNMFKSRSRNALQKKYDRLIREAYQLSGSNPDESMLKQKEAQEIQLQIITRSV